LGNKKPGVTEGKSNNPSFAEEDKAARRKKKKLRKEKFLQARGQQKRS